MSRLSLRRFPALLLVLLIALAPAAASATPISFPEVPRFVQFLLSVLAGDQGSTADSEEEASNLPGEDSGHGVDPNG